MLDLLTITTHDAPLKKVAGTHGGEYAGPCPLCGGTDRLRVWPDAERPGWWCRQCEHGGDAIQWLREVRGMGYRDACVTLGLPPARHEQPAPALTPPTPCLPPAETWQAPAHAFVTWAQEALWEPAHEAQLDYLAQRGLHALTVVNACLGYNPRPIERSRAAWGLEPHAEYGDRLWLPRGIVLPWFAHGALWKIQIRRDDTDDPEKRYYTVPGSANGLYGAQRLRPNRPAMLVEGVIDALAVQQEAGDLVAPLACGTTGARRAFWFSRLALAAPVLLSFDNEAPGAAAAAYWQRILGAQARRWLPTIKDPAAMLERGLDVRAWVQAGLEAA